MRKVGLKKMKSFTLSYIANKGLSQNYEPREFDYYSRNPRKCSALGQRLIVNGTEKVYKKSRSAENLLLLKH